MAAPVGVCYPPIAGVPNFSRNVSFTYAYFLKREWQAKIIDECNPNNNTDWVRTADFAPIEGGRDTFNFTLEFSFNVNLQNPNQYLYNCTNINDYTTSFDNWYNNLQAIANTAAIADSVDGDDSNSQCRHPDPPCPPSYGSVTRKKRRQTTVAGIQLMQSNTPGCT